jgi:hypothetical protein
MERKMAGSNVSRVRIPTIVQGTELLSLIPVNACRDGNEDGSIRSIARCGDINAPPFRPATSAECECGDARRRGGEPH